MLLDVQREKDRHGVANKRAFANIRCEETQHYNECTHHLFVYARAGQCAVLEESLCSPWSREQFH